MSETGCGDLNAVNCEPFTQSLAIRCPAGCISQLAWNPIYLGASGVQYTQFVVGSNNAYRGDSWICSAAIHAGVLSNSKGGCIVANLNPSKNETYAASSENGITSLNFNSTYPASLSFQQLGPSDSAYCTDLGFYSEGFFLPWFMILPFLNVTRKQLFWCSTIGMYLFWVFVSPDTARDDGHISGYLGSLLPGIAVLYILYTFIISHTMPKPSQFPLETSFLFVGLTWFGFHLDMLTNYIKGLPTLSFSSDMFKNTAQLPALIVLLIIVLGLIFHFSYLHYKRDTLFPLFVAYAVYFIIYFSLPHIVGLSIHVHHYIFALLCFPLTRVRNRVALICQSLLLGLFLQGILKFGFASPFDTHLQARAIYTLGTTQTLWDIQLLDLRNASAPAPAIPLTWVYPYNSTLNVTDLDTRSLQAALRLHTAADVWDRMPVNEYSLTLNDVQVYRGKQARFEVPAAGMVSPFDTVRGWDGPVYVRVAPVSFGSVLDYGDVAVIDFKKGSETDELSVVGETTTKQTGFFLYLKNRQSTLAVESIMNSDKAVDGESGVLCILQSESDVVNACEQDIATATSLLIRFQKLLTSKNPRQFSYSEPKWLAWQTRLSLVTRVKHNGWLIGTVYVALAVTVIVFAKVSTYSTSVKGFEAVAPISCSAQFLGESKCGMNGVNCSPFVASEALRCPAGCLSQTAWSPVHLGPSVLQYKPFVVGSNNSYRGDSWICMAAIHAGVLSNAQGGCLIATLNPSENETYANSRANGILSQDFNSTYPGTLSFKILGDGDAAFCTDFGFTSEAVYLPLLMASPLVIQSRTTLFWGTVFWMYIYWVFVSPDVGKGDAALMASLQSFLPAMAVLYVINSRIVRYTLPKPPRFPFDVSLLFVGCLWIGFHLDFILNTIAPLPTLDFTAHMFASPAGGILICLLLAAVTVCGAIFGWMHYKQGGLWHYVVGYAAFFGVYFILPRVVGLGIHLHHYITGLLLLPITRVRARFALAIQALLLGVFLQGVLKYGFASPVDTHLQAQAWFGKGTTRTVWNMTTQDISNGKLKWVFPYNATMNVTDLDPASLQRAFGGSSFLDITNPRKINFHATEYLLTVNDVPVYRGARASFDVKEASTDGGIEAKLDSTFISVLLGRNRRSAFVRIAPIFGGAVQDYGDVAEVDFGTGHMIFHAAFSSN
ncbi:hypothetical protein BC830DRAFT_1155068 [Chytriomyces sp. MP71]|nr:hypothetical protein BC830DRAFT_1155068 [Chytriomyces sp. MP71]